MKRTITKEIFIEIETIRVTIKRRVRRPTPQTAETGVSNHDNPFGKISARLPASRFGNSDC